MASPINFGYEPRRKFIDYHLRDKRWSVIVAHRRYGKTVACIVDMIDAAIRDDRKRPKYAYIAPLLKQAKSNTWGYVKEYGSVPGAKFHENELKLTLPNTAEVRVYGSDNPESFRGGYLDGVVLDEYGDMHPRLFPEIIRPMLSDASRGGRGWATWIGTPKGPNDFYDLWQKAEGDPNFFTRMIRASQSTREDWLSDEEWRIFQEELIDMRGHMTPEQFAREYECSFAAPNVGVYYGREMEAAAKEERIVSKVFSPTHEVHTAWDLGVNDMTVIWFFQKVGMQVWLVDYYSACDRGLDHFAKVLQDKGYKYGRHYLPHDVEQRHLGAGTIAHSRKTTLVNLGIQVDVVAKHDLADGINAVRKVLPRCVFDKDKCAEGIKALQLYHREFDELRKVYIEHPYKDWTSDPADAFRYLAMSMTDKPAESANRPSWLKKTKDRLGWVV
jgi:phage terminase large subunit